MINIRDDLKGVGRVIKKSNDAVFIELYRLTLMQPESKIAFLSISKKDLVFMIWCYDDNLKNGEWEIIDNISVESNYPKPNFWTQSPDGKYYLIPGSDTSYGDTSQVKEISADEKVHLQPYGIFSPEGLPKVFLKRVNELKLL